MWFAVSRLYNTRNYFKFRDVTERLHLLLGQSVVMMHNSSVSSVLLIVVPEWNLFFSILFAFEDELRFFRKWEHDKIWYCHVSIIGSRLSYGCIVLSIIMCRTRRSR